MHIYLFFYLYSISNIKVSLFFFYTLVTNILEFIFCMVRVIPIFYFFPTWIMNYSDKMCWSLSFSHPFIKLCLTFIEFPKMYKFCPWFYLSPMFCLFLHQYILVIIVPYSFKSQYLSFVINYVTLQCLTSSMDGMVYMVGSVFCTVPYT